MYPSLATVVAGVDGSAPSLAAALWAGREADRRGARLVLLSAWGGPPGRTVPRAAPGAAQGSWACDSLELAASRVRSRCPGLRVAVRAEPRGAVAALLRAGRDARMLVLGSYGLGGAAPGMPGTTALRIAGAAPLPAVLVGSTDTSAAGGPVLLALDAARPADDLLAFAFEHAARLGTELIVLYAWAAPGPAHRYPQPPRPDRALDAAALLADAVGPWREKWPEVRVTGSAVPGDATSTVPRHAAGAGLLVLGRRAARTRPGTVARAALSRARCPVAVVPHG